MSAAGSLGLSGRVTARSTSPTATDSSVTAAGVRASTAVATANGSPAQIAGRDATASSQSPAHEAITASRSWRFRSSSGSEGSFRIAACALASSGSSACGRFASNSRRVRASAHATTGTAASRAVSP